jgi:hypothetical protein
MLTVGRVAGNDDISGRQGMSHQRPGEGRQHTTTTRDSLAPQVGYSGRVPTRFGACDGDASFRPVRACGVVGLFFASSQDIIAAKSDKRWKF